MGSRSTKVAAAPHVKAAASPVAPAQQHHERGNHTNEAGPVAVSTQPCDLNVPPRTTTTSTQRYSEPAQTAVMATELNTEGVRHLDAFERFLAERDLMAIGMDYTALVSPVPMEQLPMLHLPVPSESQGLEEPEVQCIACCTQLPEENDSMYAQKVIKPCRACNSAYCISCVKNMFLDACKDSTRMPPRCCTQIHVHHMKSHLTAGELTEYKARYEEWSTPKPFYCPVPTCSTFIPERLLPQQAGTKREQKVDSSVETPTLPTFQCPKCEGGICTDCRQVVHPNSLCASLDLGVDADTAALLKAWGYKRCPKCSQGLKRMYGCNHMKCRCGAHFCWGCMKSRDDCEGGCNEDEDEEFSGSEPDEPEPISGSDDETAVGTQITTSETTESVTKTLESDSTGTTSKHALRPRNLDGGAAHYWEQQDLDFGEEPTGDVQDKFWECHHGFEPYTISLTEAILKHPSMLEMECVKCWRAIQPDIDTPPKPKTAPEPAKIPQTGVITRRGSPNRVRGRGARVGGRGTVARLRPAAYVPPRGLMRSDATVGTAPHLTVQLLHVAGPSSRLRGDPMEDVQSEIDDDKEIVLEHQTSNIFSTPSITFSIAQECHSCSLLVCKGCADLLLAQREAERAARTADFEARQAALIAAAAATNAQGSNEAQESTQVPTSPSLDGQSPPLLLD
ncbi:uncharacterized protein M421DRAFT_424653 [Didymella exigua CBS 183.55]|uniref:RBR-type E3 ubiquitin transferase n=1 Tax=Didymella exigua CBS 183.55 TaxID=1150837 RepID=A0A6A5RB05_9PLEO|nr:uncharacterized protein M421DRAFT_424653 [Didymella exigua CBS 183.55]KAF1924519.1 hypothetical protein M421DRAFT_424653 [Didymella exigua CBS 183.55]